MSIANFSHSPKWSFSLEIYNSRMSHLKGGVGNLD